MHIEPGIVTGAKLALSYATAAGALGYSAKLAIDAARQDGFAALALRSLATTTLVFAFFELLPHYPVGVSEVHFIFGSTLLLIFGSAPAAIGLAAGLLLQGLLFAPSDLPQYGVNVTTLLVPLFAMSLLANRIIPARTAYKDVSYGQALALSTTFQAGIIAWVAFWALYGHGFAAENITAVGSFSAAYLLVIVVEPLLDLAVLAGAKALDGLRQSTFYRLLVQPRVHAAAA